MMIASLPAMTALPYHVTNKNARRTAALMRECERAAGSTDQLRVDGAAMKSVCPLFCLFKGQIARP